MSFVWEIISILLNFTELEAFEITMWEMDYIEDVS